MPTASPTRTTCRISPPEAVDETEGCKGYSGASPSVMLWWCRTGGNVNADQLSAECLDELESRATWEASEYSLLRASGCCGCCS
jgi:hypothetical protein